QRPDRRRLAPRVHEPDVMKLATAFTLLLGTAAFAEEPPEAIRASRTWPVSVDVHALVGAEPKGSGHNAVAFGAGFEVLWRARLGGFVSVLASNGAPIRLPSDVPGIPDRISVPFGFALRPLAFAVDPKSNRWIGRFLEGFGLQAGLTVEYLRTSDDDMT